MCRLGRVPREKYDGRGETRLVAVRTKKTSQLDERPSGEVTRSGQQGCRTAPCGKRAVWIFFGVFFFKE